MPITRAALRRLCLPLPRSSCGGILARQLHATARRPNAPWPTKYGTDLRTAQNLYYDFFPCTLHSYSWRGPIMAMHGSRMPPVPDDLTPPLSAVEQDDLLEADAVRIQDDGLVYPGPVGTDPVWSGAMLMPQATFLLEITGNFHDFYEEQKAAGRDVPEPYFFTVPKGLRMPDTLLLAHQHAEMFHLMPRAGMPLSALNRELNSLFSSSACSRLPYRKWFDKYNFLDAYNKGEDEWMAE